MICKIARNPVRGAPIGPPMQPTPASAMHDANLELEARGHWALA